LRRRQPWREIAAISAGYAAVVVALGGVDGAEGIEGAFVLLGALGGGMVQWGVDAERVRGRGMRSAPEDFPPR